MGDKLILNEFLARNGISIAQSDASLLNWEMLNEIATDHREQVVELGNAAQLFANWLQRAERYGIRGRSQFRYKGREDGDVRREDGDCRIAAVSVAWLPHDPMRQTGVGPCLATSILTKGDSSWQKPNRPAACIASLN